MTKLFGTDGVRGIAGNYPLDERTIVKLGFAFGESVIKLFRSNNNTNAPVVVIARDTRESGESILEFVSKGVNCAGLNCLDAGVLPTPALSFIVSQMKNSVGCVVSASHNPFEFNGIKLLGECGLKFTDSQEAGIEDAVSSLDYDDIIHRANRGETVKKEERVCSYTDALTVRYSGVDFSGLKLAVDTSNGAFYKIAADVLNALGADVTLINSFPDGRNINQNCGSQYTETLKQTVRELGAFAGIAFDGDGDRVIMVDDRAVERDGDFIMGAMAKYLQTCGKLNKNTLVTTVMANYGLKRAMEKNGINIVQTKVGDRYVFEEMLANDYSLGGEQSGHIIIKEHLNTGDGLDSALFLLMILVKQKITLFDACSFMKKYPQLLINHPVADKIDYQHDDKIMVVIKDCEAQLEGNGRVLIRYSGTEPLLRIMVESESMDTNKIIAERIRNVFMEAVK